VSPRPSWRRDLGAAMLEGWARFGFDGWRARRAGGTSSSNQQASYDSSLQPDDDNLTVCGDTCNVQSNVDRGP
jgi:hypothetical protein